ncbi:MAG: hypothetical protein IH991_25580, partial [Planctomycetes bacterium]|nr:hypothetical protein [Planctomycetota bacterium]
MTRNLLFRSCLRLWILFAVAVTAHSGRADESPNSGGSTLKYKREYVPLDNLEELAKQRDYMTMDREKFESIMKRLQIQPSKVVGAGVTRAVYRARLERSQLVDGTAELDIVRTTDGQVTIPLDSCRLAIGQAVWEAGDPRDANVALTGNGSLVLNVDRTGKLRFPWSLAGTIERDGSVAFDVRLPPSPDNELVLDLPSDVIPQVDHGILRQLPSDADGARQSWSILLGGRLQSAIRIVSKEKRARQQRTLLLRENLFYNFVPGVVRMNAQLRLDVYHKPLNKLTIRLDPEVQLVSASVGEAEVEIAKTEGDDENIFELSFPDGIRGVDRVVRLTAFRRFDIGIDFQLPRIRVDNCEWQQGKAELFIPENISLERLDMTGCTQSGFKFLPAPKSGESIELLFLDKTATAIVRLEHQSPLIETRAGTTIWLDEAETTANVIVDLKSRRGARFSLVSRLHADWTVEDITATILESDREEVG